VAMATSVQLIRIEREWAAATAKFHQQMQMKWQFAACSHSYGQKNSNKTMLLPSVGVLNPL